MSETTFEYIGEDKKSYQIILEITKDDYFILNSFIFLYYNFIFN